MIPPRGSGYDEMRSLAAGGAAGARGTRTVTTQKMRMLPSDGLVDREILLVEDDKAIAKLYEWRLREAGATVALVTTADDAIQLLAQREFDGIVLDLQLANATPASTILNFLEERRLDPAVIVISAHSDIERLRELMPYRIAAYYVKGPEVLATLSQIISSTLETHDLKRRLRSSESNLLATYTASPFAIGIIDPLERRFVEGNPSLQRLVGAGYAELTAASPHPSVQRLLDAAARAASEGSPVVTEITRADGTRVAAEVAVSTVERDSRDYLATHVRDMTVVEEQRRRIEAIYRAASQAIVVIDSESSRYVDCNTAFERLIGYRRDQILGRPPWEFCAADEVTRIREVLGDRPIQAGEVRDYESSFVRKDGSTVPVMIRATGSEFEGRHHVMAFVDDLSEKRRVEREVEHARSRLHFFVENSDLMICFIGADGKIAEWNRSAKVKLNLTSSDMQGRYVWNVIHPRERRTIRSRWSEILEEKYMPGRWFVTLQTADKESISTEWNHTTIRDDAGRAVGILAIGEVASSEREAEVRAHSLFENALSCIVFLDSRTYRIIDINPVGAAYFNCQPSDCTNHQFLDYFADAEQQLLTAKLAATALNPVSGHARATRSDGSSFELGYRASRLAGAGRPMILIVGRDLTEIHRAETRYQALFAKVPTPLLIVRRDDRRVIDCNPAFERLVGYGLEELRAMTSFQQLQGENSRAGIVTLHDGADSNVTDKEQVYEASLVRKDSSSVLVRMRTSSFELDQQPAFISFVTDITEEIAATQRERELERTLIQAQKMEAFGQVGSGIAHEFNNVLMAAMPWAEILERQGRSEEQIRIAARQILTALRRGRDVARQMLGFARPQHPTIASFPIVPVLREQVSMLRPALPREIEIEFEASDESLVIRADVSQLNQVLLNLALNARDAMPEGGTLRVDVRTLQPSDVRRWGFSPSDYLIIVVSDSGTGMDQATALRIFDPFFTTKDIGKGSGLGLSVVHRIVNQHSGMIFVDSARGVGTTFYLLLPRAAKRGDARQPGRDEATGLCDGKKVLIVDDEPSVTAGTRAMLEAQGAIVSEAARGKLALQMLDHGLRPDFVILDLGLPEMKGEEVHQHMRRRLPDLPIIIASGYGEIDRVRPLLADRHTRFRQKPYELSELMIVVRELENERSAQADESNAKHESSRRGRSVRNAG